MQRDMVGSCETFSETYAVFRISVPVSIYPAYDESGVQFLDIVIRGKSFLHNQVRRMVGAAVAVATHKLPLEKLTELLEDPDLGWNLASAPSSGLYLASIEYEEGVWDEATESYAEMLNLEKRNYIDDSEEDDESIEANNLQKESSL
jgi:hypothetical protein